jgi:3-deoxy-D-manno-octulosonic-acid transferase
MPRWWAAVPPLQLAATSGILCGGLATRMINGYDIAYSLGLGLSAPVWLAVPRARRKVLKALRERMGHVEPRNPSRWAVMIHAVSVGEINATGALVEMLRSSEPGLQFIVSTTTDTGYERGRQLYGRVGDVTLIKYPLDFSNAVTRVLDRLKPALVVLMELEVWPNFLHQCRRRNIPVIIANGRMSNQSYRNYRKVKPVVATMLRRLTRICAQDAEYANRFIELGAPPGNVTVTGTMKFDTAQVAERVPGDAALAEDVGLYPGVEPIWVCGSTGPGEEEIVLRVYRELLVRNARLRLVIVPRKPERFDEVPPLVEAMKFRCIRRSQNNPPSVRQPLPQSGVIPPVVLGDTMGELRKFYALADVVFVGRTLVDLGSKQHGSDMIEPAALGRPTVVGPFTGNFADAMLKLRQAEAVLIAQNEAQLREAVTMLLSSHEKAVAMGRRGQDVVRREQGATTRHAQVILELLHNAEKLAFPAVVQGAL